MVTKEEIQRLANLIKIEINETEKYVEQVDKVIHYFDTLDKIRSTEEIFSQDLALENLRPDEHIPYKEKLIEKLKNSKGTFVKAPKLI